jgi:hypothetical protein
MRRTAPAKLAIEDFQFLDDLGYTLPQLILAYRPSDSSFKDNGTFQPPAFKPGREWLNIAHSTSAGQRFVLGTILTPRNRTIGSATQVLDQKWSARQLSTLDELAQYRKDIASLFGVDCNRSHRELAAGYYPIDVGYLSFVAADTFPASLDDLAEWKSGAERAASGGRWSLAILGEVRHED